MNALARLPDSVLAGYRTFDPYLADAWRGNLRAIEDHLLFIRQHTQTIERRNERLPSGKLVNRRKYVAFARSMLAHRLPLYLMAVRRVTEDQEPMPLRSTEHITITINGVVIGAYQPF